MISGISNSLLAQIRHIARVLPEERLQSVIVAMQKNEVSAVELQKRLVQILPNPEWRQLISDLYTVWQQENPCPSSQTVAAMLTTATYCHQESQGELSLEFVWTGPLPKGSHFRRTDQALLQMIREARQSLTIVSFAVYKIPEIVEALQQARKQGVKLTFIFEMPDVSDGKIAYGAIASLDQTLLEQSELLIWAQNKRPVSAEGKSGSLHAKFAIADNHKLLVSSANLTNYAMTLNMEMGVLIHSDSFALEAATHLSRLVAAKYLVPYVKP